jgi:ABC-type lipoprotein release transport system permease subunit
LIVLRNLRRHKIRATLSFLAVFFAATLFHIYVGARAAFDDLFNGSALHDTMFVKPRQGALWETTLPNAYQEEVRKVPGVVAATALHSVFARVGNGMEVAVLGVDPVAFKTVAGSDLADLPANVYQQFVDDPNAALLSRGLRLSHGLNVNQSFEFPLQDPTDAPRQPGAEARENPTIRGRLVGEIQRGVFSDRIIIVHGETLARVLGTPRGIGVLLRHQPGMDAPALGEKLEELFHGRPTEVEAVILEHWASSLHTFMKQLSAVVLALVAFIGVLAVGILSHSVSMSSFELRPQVGALRALGTSRLSVLFVLTGEGLVVSFAGATVATVLMYLLTSTTSIIDLKTISATLAPSFAMSPAGIAEVYAIAFVVVFVGAVLPSVPMTRAPVARLIQRRG